MIRYGQRVCLLVSGITVLFLTSLSIPVDAEEPTLARLSFWVPPERMEEFERAYEEQIVPVLKEHDLVASSEIGRTTVDSVFSRLFEMESPAAVVTKWRNLQEDPTWRKVVPYLKADFGKPQSEDGYFYRYFCHFQLYSAPAKPGKEVPAGDGTGHWCTYDVTDGVADVLSIVEDREGNLWFATAIGAIRYDGQGFTAFTTKDGLASDQVRAILEDREGNLWFGTGGLGVEGKGVTRYDGNTFITFSADDGLAGNEVIALLEDHKGNLWFATESNGVSCYDGTDFTTFTTEEGLVHNTVMSIVEDREGHLWFGTVGGASLRISG